MQSGKKDAIRILTRNLFFVPCTDLSNNYVGMFPGSQLPLSQGWPWSKTRIYPMVHAQYEYPRTTVFVMTAKVTIHEHHGF
jgi:hypothetical protein